MTSSGELGFAEQPGWEAALLEIEHQAEHWDTPDHGETGHLIAQALRAAVDIARTGGLKCEHRPSSVQQPSLELSAETSGLETVGVGRAAETQLDRSAA